MAGYLRSRQLRELMPFSEAVRNIAVFYDGLVVPGALLLLASGTWLIVKFFWGMGLPANTLDRGDGGAFCL